MAELAGSFGVDAVEYDRVRPEWSPTALRHLYEHLDLQGGASVVDLGAGTGKLTRKLAVRFRVVAVEPDDRMRRRIPRGIEAVPGTAENMPLADGFADCVFVGDAFHWFDGPAALREIARVLRPGGRLALLWNEWWETDPAVPEAALEVLREPFERSGRAVAVAEAETWRDAFDGAPFAPLQDESFTHPLTLSAADLVALYTTTSSIAWLPHGERAALRAELLRLLSGSYTLQVTTQLHWTRLAFGK